MGNLKGVHRVAVSWPLILLLLLFFLVMFFIVQTGIVRSIVDSIIYVIKRIEVSPR
jgi:hypothetical protein